MADTLVQQPIPQPSEVPPVASVPPVMSATPPVMSVPPSPISQKVEPPKSKIGLVVAGVVALVMMVGVGVWGYVYYSSRVTKPQIASIDPDCHSKCVADGGGYSECNMQCRTTAGGGTDCNLYGCDPGFSCIASTGVCKKEKANEEPGGGGTECVNDNSCAAGFYCGGNKSCTRVPEGQACSSGKCERIDQCIAGDGCPTSCSNYKTSWGAMVFTQEPGGGKFCDADGRECERYRIEMRQANPPSGATAIHCFVKYGEQCGEPGQCGPGTNVRSPSPKPSVPASPNPSPSPTMACTGLTQTPATQPVVGSKLTFTCAGSVTPSNASTLSYNFRYAINNGSWVNLTNKTTATAELTISACGTYKVECRACATFGGLIKCDPFWQYAGVQPL